MKQIGFVYARLNLYKIVRRPPCWKSTARLARHACLDLLDWLDLLDKVERVESSRAKWNLSLNVHLEEEVYSMIQ